MDLSILASQSKNHQTLNHNARYMTLQNGKAHNHANYFDINNSSYFYPNWGQITVNYSLSYQNNNYKRQATITDNDAYDYTPFSPSGNQNIWGMYVNNSIQKDIYTADISLSRVHTKFSGFKPACGEVEGVVIPCFPQGASSIEKSDLAWNGKMQLSAKVNDWFNPFVSYARTSRMPNIQEVFFNNQGGGSMNPFLKAENADIKEIALIVSNRVYLAQMIDLVLKRYIFITKSITTFTVNLSFCKMTVSLRTISTMLDLLVLMPTFLSIRSNLLSARAWKYKPIMMLNNILPIYPIHKANPISP